jgi:hypothetical protein
LQADDQRCDSCRHALRHRNTDAGEIHAVNENAGDDAVRDRLPARQRRAHDERQQCDGEGREKQTDRDEGEWLNKRQGVLVADEARAPEQHEQHGRSLDDKLENTRRSLRHCEGSKSWAFAKETPRDNALNGPLS